MTERDFLQHLRTAIETAQTVTAGIADPQLRSVAFGKVLDHLIASPTGPVTLTRARVAKSPRPKSARAPRAPHDGPTAWVEALRSEGFFAAPKSLADLTEAVCARGHKVESKNVTEPLEKLVRAKILKRERKPSEGEKRGVWMYVNA